MEPTLACERQPNVMKHYMCGHTTQLAKSFAQKTYCSESHVRYNVLLRCYSNLYLRQQALLDHYHTTGTTKPEVSCRL
jgi:hypothetical protein